jgi:transketolase
MLTDADVLRLEKNALRIRELIIEMLLSAGSGHTAGPLGMADIFSALYGSVAAHNAEDPSWAERDRIILSNGHIAPVRYAAMAVYGYFPEEELKTLRKFGSRLQGHPERLHLPGVETTSGPLGSGLSQASGIAYAARMDWKKLRVYALTSDGEHDAGNHWEAVLWAGAHKLSNLTTIIDRNNIQINGYTEQVLALEPLRAKYEAFGWHVIDIDGHNMREIVDACAQAKAIYEKPTAIIAHTIPGKGIKNIEFDYTWHGKSPNTEEAKTFLAELRTLKGDLNPIDHS